MVQVLHMRDARNRKVPTGQIDLVSGKDAIQRQDLLESSCRLVHKIDLVLAIVPLRPQIAWTLL